MQSWCHHMLVLGRRCFRADSEIQAARPTNLISFPRPPFLNPLQTEMERYLHFGYAGIVSESPTVEEWLFKCCIDDRKAAKLLSEAGIEMMRGELWKNVTSFPLGMLF